MNNYTIIGLILAGGEGQRVGRKNKGLLTLQEKPLVKHVLDRLKPQLDHVVISANEDTAIYKMFVKDVFPDDPIWQGKGPLAGLLTASQSLVDPVDFMLVVPCDTPFIPDDLVTKLMSALLSNPALEIAYAATKLCAHPSIFLCKELINAQLAAHLQQGKYSLKSWIFRHNAIEVLFDDEQAFTNINHIETLEKYQ